MKKRAFGSRVLSAALALCMLLSTASVVSAAGLPTGNRALPFEKAEGVEVSIEPDLPEVKTADSDSTYADTDTVRVSIVLESNPTLALYAAEGVANNSSAMAYRRALQQEQAVVTADIEQLALSGDTLDVVWNLTLAANIISANVRYGQINEIESVDGVAQVVIENRYDPLEMNEAETYMVPSSSMTGAGTAWSAGYTGAGSRIAIIDTGLDTDHISFDNGAYLYSLRQLAESRDMDYSTYVETLDLLDTAEIEGVLEKLNIYPYVQYKSETRAGGYYLSEKVPFALNYVDRDYDVTHDNDTKGEHGSHVAGIAAANRYISDGEGGYDNAIETVKTQGVAPDAQLIIMKVFGKSGGAYEADYMVAIEDAIMLGCDAVNLSLGSAKGFARSSAYQDIMDNLTESGAIVTVAAGNDGVWSSYSASGVGYLYADDVDFSNVATPAVSSTTLAVASADNIGSTDYYLSVGESIIYYNRGVLNGAYTAGLNTLGGGDYTYVFLDGLGYAEEVNAAAAALTAKGGDVSRAILVCQRGTISFAEKGNNAAAAGFAACIIYNNVDSAFNINLQDYTGEGPCSSISKADGAVLRAAAQAVTDEDGNTLYYEGTLYVSDQVRVDMGSGSVSMSSFSSWGVPGSLELKPEITAPGGGIYSVDGSDPSGTAYMNNSGTSMAAPQVAGMSAVLMQFIRENHLTEKTGLTARQLATSLLMATAEPLKDAESGSYYSLLQQGAGLANLASALQAASYIKMDDAATSGAADGKVKVELGDDPDRTGTYTFGFNVHNFSDRTMTYTLHSDFFTQGLFEEDGTAYLDTATTALDVAVSYSTGSSFTVAAGASTSVTVSVTLLDKEALNRNYVNGAYVEGFVYLTSTPDSEGFADVTYSIPVLGFYGNWSDATMYDRASYVETLYGEYTTPYTGYPNYLTLWPDGGLVERQFIGNPYLIEDSYPAGKEAIKSKTEFGDMVVSLIRGAGGFLFYVLDGEGNIVVARDAQQLHAAYYSESYGAWYMAQSVGLSIWESPKEWGFQDGDTLTIGFMSVPEYYETYGEALDAEDLAALMKAGTLGDGVYYSYTFAVDDTAPEILSVEKNGDGDLVIRASDNNYIAAVAVLDAKGSTTLTLTGTDQDTAGTVVETVVDMSGIQDQIDRDCMVLVADYAGNESVYKVSGYNGGIDYAGRMYAFTDTGNRGTANSWMSVDADGLYRRDDDTGTTYTGTQDVANMPWNVVAAEYVGGYVFMATGDNALYVAPQGDWENTSLIARNSLYSGIKDMAYSTSDKTLYALAGDENAIYSVDLATGALTQVCTVSVTPPDGKEFSADNLHLLAMAIDDNGNFYAVNNGARNYKNTYLYTWKLSAAQNGQVTAIPVNNSADGYAGDYVYNNDGQSAAGLIGSSTSCTQSMAWDHNADTLYWAAAMYSVSSYNILYSFDVETGKASIPTPAGENGTAAGSLYVNVSGLYIVPEEAETLEQATIPTSVTIEPESLTLFAGAAYTLTGRVSPWNLADSSLIWSCDDSGVVAVDESGTITALKEGSATVTVTTNALPSKTDSITVTVKKLENTTLRGLLYGADSAVNFVKFDLLDPAKWSVQENGGNAAYAFNSGTLLENTLYLHDGDHMYGVDANNFDVTDYGYLDASWLWSDAAPAPENDLGYFGRIVGVISGGMSFGVMDVTTGIGTDLIHYNDFRNDPAALIALKGSTTYSDGYGSYPAYEYYVLTEAGKLYLLTAYAFYDTDAGYVQYDDTLTFLGETGLHLRGAADVESTGNGSMYYDEAHNTLIVAYSDGKAAHLYAFDPDYRAPVEIGTFGADVWPVTALYQYESFTGTTVLVTPNKAEAYVGETVSLTAKVYLYNESNAVTWSSSDPTVASVDKNGVVTALKEGKATITAASVEGGVSGSAVITVKPLTKLDLTFHAGVITGEGGAWVSIDGNSLETETLGQGGSYTGALVSNGKIIATDKTFYYEINPADNYAVTKGDNFTDGDGYSFFYMLDGTAAPITEQTLPDFESGEKVTVNVGGTPLYISGYDGSSSYYLMFLENYATGEYLSLGIDKDYSPVAIAYHESAEVNDYWWDYYYILSADGLLEQFYVYSYVTGGEVYLYAGDWYKDTVDTGLSFTDGESVSMVYVETDEFTGLVISSVGENGVDLYCYDTVHKTAGKLGTLTGASDLVGLALMSEITGSSEPDEPEAATKTLTYKVVNGTWADGNTADIVVTVELDEDGVALLEDVPEGMLPAEGYEGGSWDIEPSYFVEGTDPVTYTYTFTAKHTGGDDDADTSAKLLGWVYSDDGMGWGEIDPETGSITLLAQDSNYYTGAGVLDGKIYAGASESYYMIDPADEYAVHTGAPDALGGATGYPLVDGSGAPSGSVVLNGETVNVGGYFLHAFSGSNGSELYILRDYTVGCTSGDAVCDSQYAIDYLSLSAVAYLSGSVSADGSSYQETFLLLDATGTLYTFTLTTTVAGLNTIGTLTEVGQFDTLTASCGASMTRLSDSTVMIALNKDDCTVLYTYTLGGDSAELKCALYSCYELHGLALMSEITGSSEPDEPEAATKTLTYKVVNGTWADGSTADIVVTVELDEDGVALLEDVPEGMLPAEGYEGGSWDIEPSYFVEGTDPVTYTYTFTAKHTGGDGDADTSAKLLGWVYSEYGMGWEEIDPETGSITLLAQDSNYYTGAGVLNGKIYAGANGSYYMIDPADEYAVHAGAAYKMGSMVDGSGVPSSSVVLSGETVNVGGYFLHAFAGSYGSELYILRDYTVGCTYNDAVCDSQYAIDYLFLSAVAYLSGSVSADGSSYQETFLLLDTAGTLYTFTLTTTVNGLNTIGTLTEVGQFDTLTASYGASMTRLSDSTVMIALNKEDCTVLYTYTLGGDAPELKCALYTCLELHGLALMSEITGSSEPEAATKTLTYKVVNGTWADGSTADIVVTVELDENGVGYVTVPTGMLPANGYEGGSWDVTPTGVVSGTEAVTYTYTFQERNAVIIIPTPAPAPAPTPVTPDTDEPPAQEPAPSEKYTDLDPNAWYIEYIDYVLAEGLMNGVSSTEFDPNGLLSRGMLATVLYRMAGKPAVTGDCPFKDVAGGTWYCDAITWAAALGIVNGYSADTFAPEDSMTREQLVTMLWRYAKLCGLDVSARADLSGYADAHSISSYAREAMEWACATGLLNGSDGKLMPQDSASRAQVAAVLKRFCENILA